MKIHQCGYTDPFFQKTWTKGHWPLHDLTPCLLRWLYPRIIVSKSHDNTSMYMDTVINFANYHIHTHTTYIHTTHYVQNEWSHSLLLNSVSGKTKMRPMFRDFLWKSNPLEWHIPICLNMWDSPPPPPPPRKVTEGAKVVTKMWSRSLGNVWNITKSVQISIHFTYSHSYVPMQS